MGRAEHWLEIRYKTRYEKGTFVHGIPLANTRKATILDAIAHCRHTAGKTIKITRVQLTTRVEFKRVIHLESR